MHRHSQRVFPCVPTDLGAGWCLAEQVRLVEVVKMVLDLALWSWAAGRHPLGSVFPGGCLVTASLTWAETLFT